MSSAGDPHATRRPWSTMPTRSHSCSASSIACVVSTTVTPRPRSSCTNDHVVARACGSMPAVGSSRNSNDGPSDQGQGQRESLLLPARHASHERLACVFQPDRVEQPLGIVGIGVVRREELQRLERADPGVQATLLEHHTHLGAELATVPPGIEAEHAHVARVRTAVSLEDLDGGGLAGTVRPERSEHLAVADLEGKTVNGAGGSVALLERDDFDRERRVHRRASLLIRSTTHRCAIRNATKPATDHATRRTGQARSGRRVRRSRSASSPGPPAPRRPGRRSPVPPRPPRRWPPRHPGSRRCSTASRSGCPDRVRAPGRRLIAPRRGGRGGAVV